MDYSQSGLVATVELEESENTTAWQRFLPLGPVALLPLSRTHSSIVWTLDSKLVGKVAKLPAEAFVELLNAAFHNPYQDVMYLLKQIDSDGNPMVDFGKECEWGRTRELQNQHPPWVLDVQNNSRQAFPLRIRHARSYVGNRSVLIGYVQLIRDAAHTIHPLAGQGLNLGLADSESLSRLMIQAIRDGEDLGHLHVLNRYESERYAPNAAMLLGCDGLNRLFSKEETVFMPLRSFGLNSLNRLDHMKQFIMKFAS
jgi:ubiquinone biosynthesis monooxygenase Coq6